MLESSPLLALVQTKSLDEKGTADCAPKKARARRLAAYDCAVGIDRKGTIKASQEDHFESILMALRAANRRHRLDGHPAIGPVASPHFT